MNNVSIILDNPSRDTDYVLLIAMHLINQGFEVSIVPTNMRHYELISTEPNYVLYPHQRQGSAREISILKECNIDVGVMETEQHVDEDFYLNYQIPLNRELLKDSVHFFSWGQDFSRKLISNGLYKNEQIKTTGNPRFDPYLKIKKNNKEKNIDFLIGTSFSAGNPKYLTKRAQLKAFIKENMPKEDFENYSDVHLQCIELLIETINSNSINLSENIVLRPHPYEDELIYKKQINNKKISINNSDLISESLVKSKSYIHYNSVSSLDAAIFSIPIINLSWFPTNNKLHPSTFFMKEISYQPENEYEMKELIDDIKNNKLPPKRNIEDEIFSEYLYKIDSGASKRIANEISNYLKNIPTKSVKKSFLHPFNDIQTYEYSLKHAYAKRQWYRSNKKFEIKLINERLKYLANLFEFIIDLKLKI